MIVDAIELEEGTRLQADVCVVGAGAAGITLALDLARAGQTVCLLESGGLTEELETQGLYEGEMAGIGDVGLTDCRVRQLGGTTNRWAGWCRPLTAEVFRPRAWMPLAEWPIEPDEMRPWYVQAQRTCEIGALEYDADVLAERAGKALLPLASPADHAMYQYSPPTRFGEVYRQALEETEGLAVYLHANLVEIETSEAGAQVTGIQCSTLDGKRIRCEAARYVIALGGVENARALLAAQDRRGLGDGREHLGRYFMDHPHFYKGGYILLPDALDLDLYLRRVTVSTEDELGDGPRSVQTRAAISLSPQAQAEHELPAMAITLRSVDFDAHQDDTGPLPSQAILDVVRGSPSSRLLGLDIRAEQRPDPESRVTLLDEVDALGMPRLKLDWRIGPEDHAGYTRSLALLGAALGRAGLGRLWMPLDEDDTYDPSRYIGGCHHMGTTRMSDGAADGVVDAQCKLHGVDNLYVAGSSVFPSAGFANPTLTIVALAHRLAHHLGGLS